MGFGDLKEVFDIFAFSARRLPFKVLMVFRNVSNFLILLPFGKIFASKTIPDF